MVYMDKTTLGSLEKRGHTVGTTGMTAEGK